MLKNKKAEELVTEQVIFIILNILFFVCVIFFIYRVSSGTSVTEEFYAKKIALIIDSMQYGTEVRFDVSELYSKASSNEYNGELITFDLNKKIVKVKLSKNSGYEFYYFSPLKSFEKDEANKLLILKADDQ